MQIEELNDKNKLEEFVSRCLQKTFLQSYNWGEFNKKEGEKVWRFGIYSGGSLISIVQVVLIKARRGTFLFIPHGPLFLEGCQKKKEVFETVVEHLKKLALKEKASFIRVSPILQRNQENIELFKSLGFLQAPLHMHPELTWELNLSPSEDELLMNMRKTTRYLIKQGIKSLDVEIVKSRNIEDIKKFNKVYQETVARHKFSPFSLNYLENEFNSFSGDDQIMIFLGKYKGEVVSSSMIIYHSRVGYYHQGASSNKRCKIPVSYLMQWEAIREAKARGCIKYNFWGIAEDKNLKESKHPWAGLSLFKMGFGGKREEYVKTQDLPLSIMYWPTHIFEKLRKKMRNL